MNISKVNEMVSKFQDLVEQKKVKTFIKFQNEIYLNFIIFDKNHKSYKFISYELKKMHAFLKEIQHYPNSHLLAQALKPMFRMLVNSIIIPRVVSVLDERSKEVIKIKYADLILASSGRLLIQRACDSFIVPFKGKPISFAPQRSFKNLSWITLFVIEMLVKRVKASPVLLNEFRQIAVGDVNAYIELTSRLMDRIMKTYLETD